MEKKKEVWRDVPGYKNYYQVSNLGRVRSLDRTVLTKTGERFCKGRIMKGSNVKGYEMLDISRDGRRERFYTHQLVAVCFLGHEPDGHTLVVDHINGVKADNRVENLQIVTQRQNASTCHRNDRDSFYSEYVGVSYNKNKQRWLGAIRYNDKQIHLGYFDNEIDASNAYQKALGEINDNVFNPENHKPKFSSNHIGVYFHKASQKWVAKPIINGKRTYLGSFTTELEAYSAIQKFKQEVKKH